MEVAKNKQYVSNITFVFFPNSILWSICRLSSGFLFDNLKATETVYTLITILDNTKVKNKSIATNTIHITRQKISNFYICKDKIRWPLVP